MLKAYQQQSQSGFVSLFTVIFFTLLITIVTLGFLRIMAIEQRQSLDNDLSASALAAAESGVEDGKRAILKYLDLPNGDSLKDELRSALNSTDCNALVGSANIRSALGLNSEGNAIGNEQLNQYYTCLNVQMNTSDYLGNSQAGVSDFIPLRTAGSAQFNRIQIAWHLTSPSVDSEGDGTPSSYATGPNLYPVVNTATPGDPSWSSQNLPAYLRVQLYGYPDGSFSRGDVANRSRTLFLVPREPGAAAAVDSSSPINFGSADPRGMDEDKASLSQIRCSDLTSIPNGTYVCTATLELPSGAQYSSANNTYFLRVTPLYGQAHFRISLLDDTTVVNMREVQPIIDVTGRAADLFRRLQVRVRTSPTTAVPEYVLESADSICKNMQVADGSYYVPNSCD